MGELGLRPHKLQLDMGLGSTELSPKAEIIKVPKKRKKKKKNNISADKGEYRVALISFKVLTLWESEIERERQKLLYTKVRDYFPFISDGD